MADSKTLEATKALVIGISGPSSSGKTTLARLLQRIFNGADLGPQTLSNLHTFIVHEDDFYYPDDQIPYTTTPSGERVQDWDTAAAIDTDFLAQALAYVRKNAALPPRLKSKEDQNDSTVSGVPDSVVQDLRAHVSGLLAKKSTEIPTIAFLEGFLLYSAPGSKSPLRPVQEQIHLPLFLPAGYSSVKARREGRSGYVTCGPAPSEPEGVAEGASKDGGEKREVDLEAEDDGPPQNFWVDPPGYVDDVVWPRYVEDHDWLLVANDGVEGDLVKRVGEGLDIREDAGVKVAPGKGAVGMEDILKWAVHEILRFVVDQHQGVRI